MTTDKLVNIYGYLRKAYNTAVPNTLRHVDELMTERRTSVELCRRTFYTADGALYFMDEKKPKLALTREPENLVLRHIDDAFIQLVFEGDYCPNPAEATSAIKARTTEVFDLSKLKLKTDDDDEFSFMEVSPTEYDRLNPEQRRLAERVYGKGDDFVLNMKMLKEDDIDMTKVYVLNPKYVREYAKSSPIGRTGWLNNFDEGYIFAASDREVDCYCDLRGHIKTNN